MKYTIVNKSDLSELNLTIQSLKKEIEDATLFIKDIENGKLDSELLNENNASKEDGLAKALLSMRDKMVQLAEEERQRNWATEGLASFVDILRSDNDDLLKLSDSILGSLVKYMKANQGWLFILNDNDREHPFLELTACYAYDRKKHLEKRIEIGEGLVGQVYLEKETIYMTQIPKSYPQITSGLGEALPTAVLIVPLKVNENVYGILELASFHDIPKYQLSFVEKLAESIASTISNVRVNERTRILLQQTQEQTEQLRSQEEEMRQNMEELHATQEEMQRKSLEVESRIDAINQSSVATIDFDMNGHILHANPGFLELTGYSFDEIKNKHHSIFVDPGYAKSTEYDQFWKDLKSGISKPGIYKRVGKNGKEIFIKATYTILKDHNNKPAKVVKMAIDITENFELKAEIAKLKEMLAKSK